MNLRALAPPWHWLVQSYCRLTRLQRIAGGAALILVLGYTALVVGAFAFARFGRGVLQVRCVDMALPWRWDRVTRAFAEHNISAGFAAARTDRWSEAVSFLRSGLTKLPEHRGGRLLYAEALLRARLPERARETLLDGIRFHRDDARYLSAVVEFLFRQEDDYAVIAVARDLRDNAPPHPARDHVLAIAAARACLLRGNLDAAEDFLVRSPTALVSLEGRLLQSRLEWERGYRELALVQLRELVRENSAHAEPRAELLRRLQELGRWDEARRAGVELTLSHPTLAAARLHLIAAYRRDRDTRALERETDAFLVQFAHEPTALLALADAAATAGDAVLVARVSKALAEAAPADAPFGLLAAEAQIATGEYAAALQYLRQLETDRPELAHRHAALFHSLRCVAHRGLGDARTADNFLLLFLQQPSLRVENLLAFAQRLAALGAEDAAERVLARAHTADPNDQPVLTRLVEVGLLLSRVDELPERVRRLSAMRRPSADVLRVAQHQLGSDRFLFAPGRDEALSAIEAALRRTSFASLR